MTKKSKNVMGIFIESIGLYFSNFDKFMKYMTFPVLGQVGGLVLVFGLTTVYAKHIPQTDDINLLLLLPILVTLPGLLIFTKAFWEYLIAYGAINSMLSNMVKSGKVYDFDAHTELIKRRTAPFVGLWCIIGLFSIVGSFPLLWVPAGVITVFGVLVFQVFTYEPEQTPIGCVKRSFELTKGHFASTFVLLTLSGLLTYMFIPQIINKLFEIIKLTDCFTYMTMPFIELFPIDEWNSTLIAYNLSLIEPKNVGVFIVTSLISQIIIQYTLPLRSILWGMWYRELNGNLPQLSEGKKKKQKPSEKLMESSHKKYSTKKLDRNLLRRAMEKDDEEI